MRHSEDVTNRIFGVIVYVNSSELACTLILYHSISVKLERKASSEARYFNAERFTLEPGNCDEEFDIRDFDTYDEDLSIVENLKLTIDKELI